MDDEIRIHQDKIRAERVRKAQNAYLATELRNARLEKGLSIAEVAREMGKSEAWVKQMEGENSNPRYNDLLALCRILEISFSIRTWRDEL